MAINKTDATPDGGYVARLTGDGVGPTLWAQTLPRTKALLLSRVYVSEVTLMAFDNADLIALYEVLQDLLQKE